MGRYPLRAGEELNTAFRTFFHHFSEIAARDGDGVFQPRMGAS
jgi:hypothetical protein